MVLRHSPRVWLLSVTMLVLTGCSHAADTIDAPAVAQPSASEVVDAECGGSGHSDCPLQSWMKANMSPAMSAGDLNRLKQAFRRLGDLGPPGYASWASLSTAGADAASRGNIEAVRGVCKQCHEEHRARYRREARATKLP